MALAVLFAHWYGLLQLYLLATFRRSITLRTLFSAFMLGLAVVAPLTLFVQQLWLRAFLEIAPLFGTRIFKYEVDLVAPYTVDPFIEEVLKALPILLLLKLPFTKRQLGVVDSILLGAAIGAGFGFAENLIRVSVWSAQAASTSTGWQIGLLADVLSVSHPVGLLSRGLLPNPMPSSIPELRQFNFLGRSWYLHDAFNPHLVWSAIAGFGIGYAYHSQKRWRLVGLLVTLWVGIDHAFYNFSLINSEITGLANLAAVLSLPTGYGERTVLALMLMFTLGWWMDYRATSSALRRYPHLLLPGEASLPNTPFTAILAIARLPIPVLFSSLAYLHQRNEIARCASNEPLEKRLLLLKHTLLAQAELCRSGFPSLWWIAEELARVVNLVPLALARILRPRGVGQTLASAALMISLAALLFSLLHGVLSSFPETRAVRQFYRQPSVHTLACLLQVGMLMVGLVSLASQYRSLRNFSLSRTPMSLAVAQALHATSMVSALGWGLVALVGNLGDPRASLLGWHISSAYRVADVEDALITLLGLLALLTWFLALCNPMLGAVVLTSRALSVALGLYSLYASLAGRRLFSQKPLSPQERLSAAGDAFLFVLPYPFKFLSNIHWLRTLLGFARANRHTLLGRGLYLLIRRATPGVSRGLRYVSIESRWTVDALERVELLVWKPYEAYKLSQDIVELRDKLASALARERLADELIWYGYPDQARRVYYSALEQYPPGSSEHIRVSLKIARAHLLQGDVERALEVVNQAIREAEIQITQSSPALHSDNPSGESTSDVLEFDLLQAQLARGELLLVAGRYEEALSSYEQALSLAKQVQALPEMHQAQLGIGESLLHLRRAEEAVTTIEHSLSLAQQIGTRPDLEARSLALLACAKQVTGETEHALSLSYQALEKLKLVPVDTRPSLLGWIQQRFTRFGVTVAVGKLPA